MGLPETQEAIDAAAAAFKTWGKTTAKVRAPVSERLEYVTEWSVWGCIRIGAPRPPHEAVQPHETARGRPRAAHCALPARTFFIFVVKLTRTNCVKTLENGKPLVEAKVRHEVLFNITMRSDASIHV